MGVLGTLYGDVRSIMNRMIFAHQSLGKIPSHGVTQKHLLHLVNEHYRIIKRMGDLETDVMKEARASAPQHLGQSQITDTICTTLEKCFLIKNNAIYAYMRRLPCSQFLHIKRSFQGPDGYSH